MPQPTRPWEGPVAWGTIDFLKYPEKPLFFCPVAALLWELREATANLLDRLGSRKRARSLSAVNIRNGDLKELSSPLKCKENGKESGREA